MPLSFAMYVLGHSVALWTFVAFYAQYQKRILGNVAQPVMLLSLFVVEWATFNAVEMAIPVPELKFAAHDLKYIGMLGASVTGLLFVLFYVNKNDWLTRRRLYLLLALPAITLVMAVTNPFHHLMWSDLKLVSFGELVAVQETLGPWGWVYVVYAYIIIFIALLFLFQYLRNAVGLFGRQHMMLLMALVFPFVTTVLAAFHLTLFDLTPFALTITGMIVSWNLFSYRLIDLAPLARNIVTENMGDGMLVLDANGKVFSANPAAQRIFGVESSDLVGRSYDALLFDLHQSLPSLQAIDNRPSGEVATSRDGKTLYLELRASPLFDDTKQIVGRVVIIRDITLRKENETRLRAALIAEKELNALRARFVSIVSHEFRTPMSIIQTATEMVQHYRDRMDASALEAKFSTIKLQIAIMNALIDDVLSLERLQNGQLSYHPERLPATKTVRQLVDELEYDAEIAERIIFNAPETDIELPIDKKLLRLVVRNLVSNALKYSPPKLPVTVALEMMDSTLLIHVTDQGIGIPEKDQTRLFDAFYRAANVGDLPGSGLGLMIVKQALDLHGGKISFISHAGRGTTFSVSLPLASPVEDE
ncbi:MAG: PAS domain S-box protein [Anaerolineae bacterium]|nr:PAS domain S-box protein [Anaerolineae bacterium]